MIRFYCFKFEYKEHDQFNFYYVQNCAQFNNACII